MRSKRVVVTGMGIVSPLGCSVESTWSSIRDSRSAIKRNSFRSSKISATVDMGSIGCRNEGPSKFPKNVRLDNVSPFAKFALTAAKEATRQAKIESVVKADPFKVAVIVGSGFGEINSVHRDQQKFYEGKSRVSPYSIPQSLMDSAAVQVSLAFGVKGTCISLTAACATGSECIGHGTNLIRSGKANLVICGAAEHSSNVPFIHSGFSSCKALSKRQTHPEKASRPFDSQRDGFVISEGAGIVVIEEREFALRRGAKAVAEVLGHGSTSDSFHMTAPADDAKGALKAMELTLENSSVNIPKEEIDFVVAHASSTVAGDSAENKALGAFFGGKRFEANVCAFKGGLGHTLGASGAIEVILGIKCMQEGALPAILNLENLERNFDLNYLTEEKKGKFDCFLANSFGFGGHNSCLLLSSVS